MALVTLTVAKQHLRITDTDHDADIVVKLAQAEAAIVEYLSTSADPAWTSVTVPGPVSAAILLMLARLYEHRGDAEKEDADTWLALERLLARSRNPALA